jgi:hypothetical protein
MFKHFRESFAPTLPAHGANASFLAFTFWSQHTYNVLLQTFQLLAAVGSVVVTVITVYRLLQKIRHDKQQNEKDSSPAGK